MHIRITNIHASAQQTIHTDQLNQVQNRELAYIHISVLK